MQQHNDPITTTAGASPNTLPARFISKTLKKHGNVASRPRAHTLNPTYCLKYCSNRRVSMYGNTNPHVNKINLRWAFSIYEKSQFICAFFSFRFTSHMKLSSRHLFLKANHPPTIIPNKRTMLLSLRNSWTQTKLLHYETRYLWDSFKDFIFSVGASGPPDRAKGGQGIKRCTSGLFVLPFLLTITKNTHNNIFSCIAEILLSSPYFLDFSCLCLYLSTFEMIEIHEMMIL